MVWSISKARQTLVNVKWGEAISLVSDFGLNHPENKRCFHWLTCSWPNVIKNGIVVCPLTVFVLYSRNPKWIIAIFDSCPQSNHLNITGKKEILLDSIADVDILFHLGFGCILNLCPLLRRVSGQILILSFVWITCFAGSHGQTISQCKMTKKVPESY